MVQIRSAERLAAAAVVSAFIALAFTSRAEACEEHTVSSAQKSGAACERARQFAWFKRQMELTDGDTDPCRRIATPAECLQSETHELS